MNMSSNFAWIAIGSNQGNSLAIYKEAVVRLGNHPMGLRLVAQSSAYRTQPVGPVRQPWFVNGVVQIESRWGPQTLMRILQRIEAGFGRNRQREKRWGPRRLDLDLLFCGQRIIRRPELKIPHPQLHLRRFVLVPLAEISPALVHPIIGKTVDMLLRDVDDVARVERLLQK